MKLSAKYCACSSLSICWAAARTGIFNGLSNLKTFGVMKNDIKLIMAVIGILGLILLMLIDHHVTMSLY